MNNYYFTFGSNHYSNNINLANKYAKVQAEDYFCARVKFMEVRGMKWAFQYEEADFLPQIKKYNLKEISLNNINKQYVENNERIKMDM